MKPKTFTLRFHLNIPSHRQAYSYLQSLSGSRNAAVIDAINQAAEQEDYWDTFRRVLREETGQLPAENHLDPAPADSDGSEDLVMDALEFFR